MSDIPLTLGSDLTFTGVWRDEAGAAMDMTGHTLALFNAHPLLADATIQWTNAATGAFSLVCQHRADWTVGRLMSFRIRASLAGVDISSPEVWVNIT